MITINLTDIGIKAYNNYADMVADSANQSDKFLLFVEDSSADIDLSFPVSETRLWATYRWDGVDHDLISAPFQESGSGGLPNDVLTDLEVGGSDANTIIPAGITFEDYIKLVHTKVFYPTFTSASYTGTTPTKEVGTSTNLITTNYNKALIKGAIVGGIWNPSATQGNRTGDANKIWIDGIDNGTSLSATVTQLTTLGTNTVPIKVDYDAGDQPTDSKGNNYLTALPPGSITNNVTWTGFYYRTAISGTNAPTATDIRNNYTTRRTSGGVINLATGTTAKRFDVFVPQGSVLSSAIDEGNLNLDITSKFVLQTDFSGLDANGDVVMYKHYLREVDNAYVASSNLKITVT